MLYLLRVRLINVLTASWNTPTVKSVKPNFFNWCYNVVNMAEAKIKRKPTVKQKIAIKHILNGDSVSKAMIKAGYSPKTAKDPQRLTNSGVFIDTLEKTGISDDLLAQTLLDGLNATKTIVMGKESSESFVDIQPDIPTRLKALDIGLKLKGHNRDNTVTNNTIVLPILGGISVQTHDSNSETDTTIQED